MPKKVKSAPISYEQLPDFLTFKELCQYLRIGANKGYEWVNRVDFPKVPVGNRKVYPKALVRDWAESEARKNIIGRRIRVM